METQIIQAESVNHPELYKNVICVSYVYCCLGGKGHRFHQILKEVCYPKILRTVGREPHAEAS